MDASIIGSFGLLKTPEAIEEAVRQILPQIQTLASKLQLIDTVGYTENMGHKLISEAAANELERSWRDEVRAAKADSLAAERGLLLLLFSARTRLGANEAPIEIPDVPEVTLSILKSAEGEVLGQTIGDRAVQRTRRLAWKELIELYGTEEILRRRIESLKGAPPPNQGELLSLIDKYLAGTPPPDIFRR